jgi:hypothetical protein
MLLPKYFIHVPFLLLLCTIMHEARWFPCISSWNLLCTSTIKPLPDVSTQARLLISVRGAARSIGKPYPMALWLRRVGFAEEGHSHRSAATRFRVSVKFVNAILILKKLP